MNCDDTPEGALLKYRNYIWIRGTEGEYYYTSIRYQRTWSRGPNYRFHAAQLIAEGDDLFDYKDAKRIA